jgi:hypothetical protein
MVRQSYRGRFYQLCAFGIVTGNLPCENSSTSQNNAFNQDSFVFYVCSATLYTYGRDGQIQVDTCP